jgi:hypothetical protein
MMQSSSTETSLFEDLIMRNANPRGPQRSRHLLKAICAFLLIVWEMQSRFNIGVPSTNRG